MTSEAPATPPWNEAKASGSTAPAADRRFAAVVLAGSRPGPDPVAALRGVPEKCLAEAGGVPMVLRVVRALRASPWIGRIVVVGNPASLRALEELRALEDAGEVAILPSAPSLSLSALAGVDALSSFPVLVTTADHALLDAAILDRFCRGAMRSGVDIVAGLTPASSILEAYPESRRTFWRFADGRWSGANLYALLTPAAREAVVFWRKVEQERKRPWRIARAFGWRPLLLYFLARPTLDYAFEQVSGILGCRAAAVRLPIAEAAIDVDKPADLELVERILARRGSFAREPRGFPETPA